MWPDSVSVIRMSRAYESMMPGEEALVFDNTDISGTRCYLDEEAEAVLTERLGAIPLTGIHFIDSGNYHYLSLLFLRRVKCDFHLVHIDFHPDSQLPAFGDITSCGGWIAKALEELGYLKNVYMYGISEELVSEMKDRCFLDEALPDDGLPVYVSVDKDALTKEFAVTDWDQGGMSLEELLEVLKACDGHDVLGVDICGDTSEPSDKSMVINAETNRELLDFFSSFH